MTRRTSRERKAGGTWSKYPRLSTTPACEDAVHDANRATQCLSRMTRICTPVWRSS